MKLGGGILRIAASLRKAWPWLVAQMIFIALGILKLLPAVWAINLTDRIARFVGLKLRRHKLMQYNLKRAFPEKSLAEREAIASEAWGSMGRLIAEYVYLDRLFDFDPEKPGKGRIEVSGIPIFQEIKERQQPFIIFTAHSGNFELLPVAGNAFGLDVTVLFRPPNNPYIADKIKEFRAERMGDLVPSHAGSSFALARQLENGGGIGILVDQKFQRGLETSFFGLPVHTNPLLAKLVRQFNCPVYPARSVRLPGNRFRLELEPELLIPRKPNGDVDVQATAQALNDKIEQWVRENPGQWLWYHDRWDVKRTEDFRNFTP